MPLRIAPRWITIRTRLDVDTVLALLGGIAAEPEAHGTDGFVVEGRFSAGWVRGRDFDLDFRLGSSNNSSSMLYHVVGTVDDGRDWRMIHAKIGSRSPWLDYGALVAVFVGAAWGFATTDVPMALPAGLVGIVLGITLLARLLLAPAAATEIISMYLARTVQGSVHHRGRWIVPGA